MGAEEFGGDPGAGDLGDDAERAWDAGVRAADAAQGAALNRDRVHG